MWVFATCIPGSYNQEVDAKSRIVQHTSECKLNPGLFSKIIEGLGKSDINLFTSRVNIQHDIHTLWYPEPEV